MAVWLIRGVLGPVETGATAIGRVVIRLDPEMSLMIADLVIIGQGWRRISRTGWQLAWFGEQLAVPARRVEREQSLRFTPLMVLANLGSAAGMVVLIPTGLFALTSLLIILFGLFLLRIHVITAWDRCWPCGTRESSTR